ncbi:uncharacterized protein LOC144102419 [Amblyomma americanum]
MWGAVYTRMRSAAPLMVFRDSLHTYLETGLENDSWSRSDFDGFAIVHTVPPVDVNAQLIEVQRRPFTGDLKQDVVPEGWQFLHTILPLWQDVSAWNFYKYHNLRSADIAGITTSFTTNVPYWAMGDIPQLFGIYPPNPISSPAEHIVGMANVVSKFDEWAEDLNKTGLCFSLTTACNAVRITGGDFSYNLKPEPKDYERYSRRRTGGDFNLRHHVVQLHL